MNTSPSNVPIVEPNLGPVSGIVNDPVRKKEVVFTLRLQPREACFSRVSLERKVAQTRTDIQAYLYCSDKLPGPISRNSDQVS
jgi:hypothetical protein